MTNETRIFNHEPLLDGSREEELMNEAMETFIKELREFERVINSQSPEAIFLAYCKKGLTNKDNETNEEMSHAIDTFACLYIMRRILEVLKITPFWKARDETKELYREFLFGGKTTAELVKIVIRRKMHINANYFNVPFGRITRFLSDEGMPEIAEITQESTRDKNAQKLLEIARVKFEEELKKLHKM